MQGISRLSTALVCAICCFRRATSNSCLPWYVAPGGGSGRLVSTKPTLANNSQGCHPDLPTRRRALLHNAVWYGKSSQMRFTPVGGWPADRWQQPPETQTGHLGGYIIALRQERGL